MTRYATNLIMTRRCSYLLTMLLLVSAVLAGSHHAYAQQPEKKKNTVSRIYNKLYKEFLSTETSDTSRPSSFFILPAIGFAQETGAEVGLASSYSFYMDRTDLLSRTSTITVMGTVTTKNQKNVKLNTDIWTKGNDYHIITELRYRDWPMNFYGIGNDTWKEDEDYIGQKLTRIKLEVERRVVPKLYAGLNVNYEDFKINDIEAGGIFERDAFSGKQGGRHLILGGSVLYDTRDFTTYATRGYYTRLKYGYAPKFFTKADFVGHQFEADYHSYHSLSRKWVIAVQAVYRGTYGDNVPYFVLRELGGDTNMRGYYLGRYRDKNFLTAQSEARFRFHPRFGIVGFVASGTTFSKEHSARYVPSYGLGFRYFFNLEHNNSLRFDYAFGEKRSGEARQKGFYLSLSESF